MTSLLEWAQLPRSTVQRIVNALADEYLLIAASANARVKLGPAILRMAASANFDFDRHVREHLKVLGQALEKLWIFLNTKAKNGLCRPDSCK